jgi:hypothetical protein
MYGALRKALFKKVVWPQVPMYVFLPTFVGVRFIFQIPFFSNSSPFERFQLEISDQDLYEENSTVIAQEPML